MTRDIYETDYYRKGGKGKSSVYWYTVDIDSHSSLLALQSSYPSIVIHFTVVLFYSSSSTDRRYEARLKNSTLFSNTKKNNTSLFFSYYFFLLSGAFLRTVPTNTEAFLCSL